MSDSETERMNTDSKNKEDASQPSERRRRLLKGVAAAAPVMLTVANKPAWGGYNCTLSGQLSGNLSHPDIDEECGGEGCTPGFWKNHRESWLTVEPYRTDDSYSAAFGIGVFMGMSLGQVIQLCDESYDPGMVNFHLTCSETEKACVNLTRQLGFHSVAALQNAGTALSYALSVDDVIMMTAAAFGSNDVGIIEDFKNKLDDLNNNSYCPFGGNSACGQRKKK